MKNIKHYLDLTFWKFILVGIINTLVGTTVMFVAYNLCHLNYWVSSASNYVVGSIVSYFLNKYFTFKQMPVVSSQYWNMVHGTTPAEVRQDLEGMQTMRTLGKNMAFLLQCKRIALENGLKLPEQEPAIRTSFVGGAPLP